MLIPISHLAESLGSHATTRRGQLRAIIRCTWAHQHIRNALAPASKSDTLRAWQEREKARHLHADAKRAAGIGGGERQKYLRRLRSEYAALTDASTHETAAKLLAEINGRRAALSLAPLPMPALRIYSYGKIMRQHGPIPRKSGAGDLTENLVLGDTHDCRASRDYGDRGSVAKSYGYPVWDHHVEWEIPADHEIVLIGGLVTSVRRGDISRSRRAPIPCHWAEKSAGYAGKWIAGYLYRGYHARSERGLVERVSRDRHEAAAAKWAARHNDVELRRAARTLWVSRDSLRAVGACDPGIDSARRKIETALSASGEIGGVRADWLLSQPDYAPWARRVIERTIRTPQHTQ